VLKKSTRKSTHPSPLVMVRFGAVVLRVPRYLRLAYRLTRDGRLTLGQRLLAVAGGVYMISPIDPIPGIIPVLGQLDDLAVLLLTLRTALRSCPPEIAAEHMARTGVTFAAIEADLAAVRATLEFIADKVGRTIGAVVKGLTRAGQNRAGAAVQRLRRPRAGKAE